MIQKTTLKKGRFFEFVEDDSHRQKLENIKIGFIGREESNIIQFLKKSDLRNFTFLQDTTDKKDSILESFVKNSDIVVFDASIHNPQSILDFNKIAFKHKTPWLLIQGVRNGKGYFGPLFYGEETGCYNCFLRRIKSNLVYDKEYIEYEDWLVNNKLYSKKGRHDKAYDRILSSMVVLELKKFLLDFGFPHTYGNLLEMDFDKYKTKLHPLYKVPFCPVCYKDVEFSRAPWLSPATLKDV